MVTSPGGTSAAALHELESGRLRTVLSEAVWAAYRRTVELGDQLEASASGRRPRRPDRADDVTARRRSTVAPSRSTSGARRSPRSAARRPARSGARPLGRRGRPVGSAGRDLGRARRRGVASARRRAVRRRRRRTGRSPSTSATSPPGRSSPSTTSHARSRPARWPTDERLRRRRLRHGSTSASASRGRRCRATRSSVRLDDARPALLALAHRLPPEAIRERRRLGLGLPGAPRPLPRPSRGHRAVDGRAPPPRLDDGRRGQLMPTAPTTPSPNLTIEAIVAVDAPREFRLHPRDRVVAYTAEVGGARQLFTLSLRGGYPTQVTASEKAGLRPAVVARRPPPRVRARRRGLGRRGGRLAHHAAWPASPVAGARRAGRPTAIVSRSSRAGAAGRRSGRSMRPSRAAADRPRNRNRRDRSP